MGGFRLTGNTEGTRTRSLQFERDNFLSLEKVRELGVEYLRSVADRAIS